jgi:hypothetical protein
MGAHVPPLLLRARAQIRFFCVPCVHHAEMRRSAFCRRLESFVRRGQLSYSRRRRCCYLAWAVHALCTIIIAVRTL